MLELTCTTEEKIAITASPVTVGGAPAAIDGEVTVTVLSGEGTFEMTGPITFWVISSDIPGDTQFLVEADADLGEGIVKISDIVKLSVTGAMAANFGLVAEAPVLK